MKIGETKQELHSPILIIISVLRIRIHKDPHNLAGSGSGILDADPDPDPRLQNWHLINLFSVEKYCK
jgi:hypothetical protein